MLKSNATFAAEARRQYDTSRSGPLTNPHGEFLLFLPLSTLSNNTKALVSQTAANGPSASLPQNVPAEVARGYAAQFAALNKKMVATDAAMNLGGWKRRIHPTAPLLTRTGYSAIVECIRLPHRRPRCLPKQHRQSNYA